MNCTVTDNTGSNPSGEALWRANGSYYEIYNSIFWNLTTDLIYDDGGTDPTSTIDYCDVTHWVTLLPEPIYFQQILSS